jgi:lauroyl/myristoyl acyltransferase
MAGATGLLAVLGAYKGAAVIGAAAWVLLMSPGQFAAQDRGAWLHCVFADGTLNERERALLKKTASTGITFFEMAIAWWWPAESCAAWSAIEVGACCVRPRPMMDRV